MLVSAARTMVGFGLSIMREAYFAKCSVSREDVAAALR